MNWTSVIEGKPNDHAMVMVVNSKVYEEAYSYPFLATYFENQDVFVLQDLSFRKKIHLEVTHWLEVPEFKEDAKPKKAKKKQTANV